MIGDLTRIYDSQERCAKQRKGFDRSELGAFATPVLAPRLRGDSVQLRKPG
jgi:hypothetical protein